jgi:cellulose 1,4-beta-cellobiosidase
MIRLENIAAMSACVIATACSGVPARPSAPAAVSPAQGNPFEGADFYVDPSYAARIEATIPVAPERAAQLRKLESLPTALWLDSIASVASVGRTLDEALARQTRTGRPVVTVLVVYDLPERDCAARASAGELAAAAGGEGRYEAEFIEPLAAQLRAHASQRVAIVVEPDSLANIATNTGIARCAAAEGVYRRSIALAIRRLSMPSVWLYLDAAHAGWLGWARNRAKIAQIYRDVLTQAGGFDKVRGFATNVSNYDTLRGGDIARLEPSDPCPDELTYVEKLTASLAEVGIVGKGFLVDTSRNGRAGIKSKSGSWCNVAGAGLGERPQSSPAPGVDAYWWIKPPGDSDGGSEPFAPGYDPNCGAESPDSLRGAPRAGRWFAAQLLQLVDNASPPVQ